MFNDSEMLKFYVSKFPKCFIFRTNEPRCSIFGTAEKYLRFRMILTTAPITTNIY